MVRVKGHEFSITPIRNSFSRRAQQLKNTIINNLKAIGVHEDDIEIKLEPIAIRNAPASTTWYLDGSNMEYSYKLASRFIDNLQIVSKVIELEITEILEEKKPLSKFIMDFAEKEDVKKERKRAREHLGLDPDTLDLELINKKYKILAKDLHPDMPNGSTEKFKALNHAHKVLKRELE